MTVLKQIFPEIDICRNYFGDPYFDMYLTISSDASIWINKQLSICLANTVPDNMKATSSKIALPLLIITSYSNQLKQTCLLVLLTQSFTIPHDIQVEVNQACDITLIAFPNPKLLCA